MFLKQDMLLRKFFPLYILSLLLCAAPAHAQFSSGPAPVQYTANPEVPGPNQEVDMSLQGIGTFLGDATITWKENGVVVNSGIGLTTHSIITGGVGTVTDVNVTIVSTINGTITHDFVFAPSVVYLVWESNTSVPLFYTGKSLYTPGAPLKIVAIPFVVSGKALVPASKLSFQWTRNDNFVPGASGTGKNVFSFNGDQLLGSENVSVDVLLSGVKVGHSSISVQANSPQVILYDNDPLRGEILERALPATFNFSSSQLTLQAEPYFFSNSSVSAGKIQYTWTVNGQETTGPSSAQGILSLRQTGAGTGSATVGVTAQNTDNSAYFQSASQALQLTFGQAAGNALSSFLGL